MLPSLSIVIPTHNRPDLLRACLTSVVRHAPPDTEIVVVDDGSPHGSAAKVASAFPGTRLVHWKRSRGFCAAANAGILEGRGNVVELLNDDTEVTAGWAEAALRHFDDPTIGAVAPLVLCWPAQAGDAIVDSAGDRYYLGGVAGKRGHRQNLGSALLRPCSVFGASASSAFFRRDLLLRVGAFPKSFGAYFEDVDLSWRLHWAGFQVLFEPAARVLHRVSASYGRRPTRWLLQQQSQNEERVFWRNLPSNALLRALPHHAAVLAGKAWRRWQEGSLLPFVFGRLRVLSEMPAVVRHRRWVHQLGPARRLSDWHVEPRFCG